MNTTIKCRTPDTRKAIRQYLRFFLSDVEEKAVHFRKLASFAARMCLCAMKGLEALAAFSDLLGMAQGLRFLPPEHLPQQTMLWLRNPTDITMLLELLTESYMLQKVSSCDEDAAAFGDAFDDDEDEGTAVQEQGAHDWSLENGVAFEDWQDAEEGEDAFAAPARGQKRKSDALKIMLTRRTRQRRVAP